MKKENKRSVLAWTAVGFLLAFVIWTVGVSFVDRRTIGPRDSVVGFAALNGAFHRLTGTNMALYVITDWLGLVPIAVAFGFGWVGLIQWIKRKDIRKVDYSICALGIFYIVVIAAYIFFEEVVINYRPVLIEGYLEGSYPSSTTLLVTCVMPTACMQFAARIQREKLRKIVLFINVIFILFMVFGRLISGVHWLSDIIGGGLLSAGLDLLYAAVCMKKWKKEVFSIKNR